MKNGNKLTLKQQIINFVAANGPVTKKEVLTALGKKTTSYISYFTPVNYRTHNAARSPYYDAAHYEKEARASLVASGQLIQAGKNSKGEMLYAIGPMAGRLGG